MERDGAKSYAVWGQPTSRAHADFGDALAAALERDGFRASAPEDADLVVNLIDPDDPKPFRRRARGTFVAAIHERETAFDDPEDVLKTNYPLLVRALANIVLCFVPAEGVWFTTMERGHYGVRAEDGHESLADGVIERLAPLALSKLVIDNEFRTDLEPELWDGDEITEEIRAAGMRMGDLDLLPAPFPIEQLLDERDHPRRLALERLAQLRRPFVVQASAEAVERDGETVDGRDGCAQLVRREGDEVRLELARLL